MNSAERTSGQADRIPALDGLRGIAIALVMFTHFWKPAPPVLLPDRLMNLAAAMGWIGVDLFFVLSGFLITGILLDSRNLPGFYRSFYARRVLRLVPVYYLFLAATFWIAPRLLPNDFAVVPFTVQVWVWAYASNLRVFSSTRGHIPPTIGHFWSLAVEEQFYLVWPWVVQRLDEHRLAQLCVAIIAIAPLLRFATIASGAPTSVIYVSTIMRADALAAGALIALAMRHPRWRELFARWSPVVALVCLPLLAIILLVGGTPMSATMQVVGFSVTAIGFAGLLVTALHETSTSPLDRLLRSRTLRALGRYSYSLYVIHPTVVYLMVRHGIMSNVVPTLGGSSMPAALAFLVVGVAISVALAWAIFATIERPMLRLKRLFPRPTLAGSAI